MSFIQFIDAKYPSISQAVFHIPNGGKRNVIEAARLKKAGVRKGVWDICCNLPHPKFNGLWIEFKSKNGRLTPEQKNFLKFIIINKQDWAVCYTLNEAIEVFENYIHGKEISLCKPNYLIKLL